MSSVWESYHNTWPRTEDDTYVISDLVCPEFDSLMKSGDGQQIQTFVLSLDKNWDIYFKGCHLAKPACVINNTKGEAIGASTYSSIFLKVGWILCLILEQWLLIECSIPSIHLKMFTQGSSFYVYIYMAINRSPISLLCLLASK